MTGSVKYHINPRLGPKRCSVTVGTCHFPQSEHFENINEAQSAFEITLKEEFGIFNDKINEDFKKVRQARGQLNDLLEASNRNTPASSISWGGNIDEMNSNEHGNDAQHVTLNRIKNALEEEKVITDDMINSLPQNVRLDGLTHRVKSPKSVLRKLNMRAKAKKGGEGEATFEELGNIAGNMTDIVRYSCVASSHDSMAPMIVQHSEEMIERGYIVKGAENSYVEGNSYKGFRVVWESVEGEQFEVQYLSEKVVVAKAESHGYYEVLRDKSKPLLTRKANEMMCVSLYGEVDLPVGLDRITHIGGVSVTTKTFKKL